MKTVLKLFCIFLIQSNLVIANDKIWHETIFSSKQLERKFKKVHSRLPKADFEKIFTQTNLACPSNVFDKLLVLKKRNIKFALISAHKNSYLDEVELDILLDYAKSLKDSYISNDEELAKYDSYKGIVRNIYSGQDFNSCLSVAWEKIQDKIKTDEELNKFEVLKGLNNLALKQNLISENQFYLLEMLRNHSEDYSSNLSISSYYQKRNLLKDEGLKLNDTIRQFHLENRSKGEKSARYNVFNNFSLLQQKEMLALLETLNERFKAHKSEILYFKKDGSVKEEVEMTHTEKLRMSLKLYQREKNTLLKKTYFKGKNFSYRDLVTLSYQTSKISDIELDYLSALEQKAIKTPVWKKAINWAGRFDFLVTALTGPVIGISYSLVFSLTNTLINKTQQKPKYQDDLFYGSCEVEL